MSKPLVNVRDEHPPVTARDAQSEMHQRSSLHRRNTEMEACSDRDTCSG